MYRDPGRGRDTSGATCQAGHFTRTDDSARGVHLQDFRPIVDHHQKPEVLQDEREPEFRNRTEHRGTHIQVQSDSVHHGRGHGWAPGLRRAVLLPGKLSILLAGYFKCPIGCNRDMLMSNFCRALARVTYKLLSQAGMLGSWSALGTICV